MQESSTSTLWILLSAVFFAIVAVYLSSRWNGYVYLDNVPSGAASRNPPIKLPIYKHKFLILKTGNPGKNVKYLLDFSLNETYLFDQGLPIAYSRTYTSNSEIVYLGTKKIRLPVNYERPPQDYSTSLYTFVRHGGVLGLGPASPVWKLWSSVTISSSTITFGQYDNRDMLRSGATHFFSGTERCRVNGKEYDIVMDLSSDVTYLPSDIYHMNRFDIDMVYEEGREQRCMSTCEEMHIEPNKLCKHMKGSKISVTADDYTVTTAIGNYPYRMSAINKENENEIRLGTVLCDRFVTYIDWVSGSYVVHDSFDYFSHFPSDDFNLYLSIISAVIYSIWLIVINTDIAIVERTMMFLFLLQLYGIIVSFTAFLYNVWGLNGVRHFVHLLDGDPSAESIFTLVSLFYLFSIAVNFFLAIATSRSTPREKKKCFESLDRPVDPHRDLVNKWDVHSLSRRSIFETTMLLTIWMTQLEYHVKLQGFLYILIIALIWSTTQVSMFYMALVRNLSSHSMNPLKDQQLQGASWFLHLCLAIVSLLFLIRVNLVPYLNFFYSGHPCYGFIIIFIVTSMVLTTAHFVFVQIERAHISCMLHTYFSKAIQQRYATLLHKT